ncbi:MAG: hypothetical protein IPP17_24900 [Bacteroidetes bacterium]|nr:hypothetical protein [Bacteroidota bacterium]
MTQLKDHIRRMLLEFIHEIEAAKWQGKERELVSHFAFSKLVKNVGCCPEFQDVAQIAIEVRVKQVKGRSKENVCKDMMIWPKPGQTFMDKGAVPCCIIEWKHRLKEPYPYDVEWLRDYTRVHPDCFGIALTVENEARYRLRATLIENGEVSDQHWI